MKIREIYCPTCKKKVIVQMGLHEITCPDCDFYFGCDD